MASITTQTIRIDLNTGKSLPTVFSHQNDTQRKFVFKMYNNGLPYDMTGNTVKFAYASPTVNGQYKVIVGDNMATGTVNGNEVSATLPKAYTEISGVGLLTMVITPSSGSVRPVNIKLVVQKSADGDDTITMASDFPSTLEDTINDSVEEWMLDRFGTESLYRTHEYVDAEPTIMANTMYYCRSALSDDVSVATGSTYSAYASARVAIQSGYEYKVSAWLRSSQSSGFCKAILEYSDGTYEAVERMPQASDIDVTDYPVDVGDAAYLIVTSYASKKTPSISKALREFVYDYAEDTREMIEAANLETIPTFERDVETFTPVDVSVSFTDGELWRKTGLSATGENWYRSNKIAVIPNTTYQTYNMPRYGFMYNVNGEQSTHSDMFDLGTDSYGELTIPEDVYYIGLYQQLPRRSNPWLKRITPTQAEAALLPSVSDELSLSLDNFMSDSVVLPIIPLKDKVIVNFGDSIIGNFSAPEDVSTFLSDYTGATVYNCGFGGNTMATHYNENYAKFSFHNLVDAIVSGSWTAQDNALASDWQSPTTYPTRLATLKSIDFTKVDYITISFGTNDWSSERPIDNESNPKDVTTYLGAFRYSVEKLINAYPQIKVFPTTPIFRTRLDDSYNVVEYSDTWENESHKLLPDYCEALESVSREYGYKCIDNYYELGFNKMNRLLYYRPNDGTHPSVEGRKRIAQHIAHDLF